MQITVIKNQNEWDSWFLQKPEPHSFAQSWAWGDILISEGKKVERLAIIENELVIAQAQVVYSPIFFGWQYAFCPKGPVVDSLRSEDEKIQIYKIIKKYLKNKNCIFFRIEPGVLPVMPHSFFFKKTIDINPSTTLLLNLNQTAAQLRGNMHPKTRYNIALAEKKNIKIVQEKNLEVFWMLMNKTGSRDKFSLHHKKHYEKILAAESIFQLTAYYNSVPVACAVFIGFGNTFTYLYGASDYEYRNLMAPYLLQWEGMELGNDFGSKWYDFFGVAPRVLSASSTSTDYIYDDKHQYAGVTRFKLGFGGIPYEAPGTFDLVSDKTKYKIYTLLRWLRRLF